jgi:hypothetical protein
VEIFLEELLEPVMEWTVYKELHGNASHSYQRNGFARLEDKGMLTRLQTALKIEAIAEPYIKRKRYVTLRKAG